MRRIIRFSGCLIALTMNAPCEGHGSNGFIKEVGTPAGFDDLALPKSVSVDLYFGERKIGETSAVSKPGSLTFRSPVSVLAKIPNIVATPAILSGLTGDLPTNSHLVCSESGTKDCGVLNPETIGIIYDETRFRADIFVNPSFLKTFSDAPRGYIPLPSRDFALTDAFGFSASGAVGGSFSYNLQNRTIVAVQNARLRINTSFASKLGLVVDDFVGEVDRKDFRYSAGLFWAPGNDFTGQRRLIGAGIGTQFDTRADEERLRGTPLILFLSTPAVVDLVADGRLIGSRSYPAGNNEIDTSSLSEGSYSILLRIHQANGSVHEESRFFVKSAQVAPVGHPIFYAFAGVLANTTPHRPLTLINSLYYQGGSAWRLTPSIALDGNVVGTQRKTMFEAGGWVIRGSVRFRAAGLLSTSGDYGALLQLVTSGHGPINMSVDLRRVWSADGKPLIPLPGYVDTFDTTPPAAFQFANGTYTQATGNCGMRVGAGYVSFVGSYRKDRKAAADYTVGPTITYPIFAANRLQLVLNASAQRTRTTTASFAGLRLFFTSDHMSILGSLGGSTQSNRAARESTTPRTAGNLTAEWSDDIGDGTSLNVAAGFDRDIDNSTAHLGTVLDSTYGGFRADLLKAMEGRGATQYDVAFHTGMAFGPGGVTVGGRTIEQSAITISVRGDAPNAQFNVLVDDVVRGQVRMGRHLSIFVPPYRTYHIRLVPIAAAAVSYDPAPHEVTLYPGNVSSLVWNAQSYFTVFGQAFSANHQPIADALVQSARGIGQTDAHGYFQIESRRDEPITISRDDEPACRLELGPVEIRNDLASVGKVICQ